MHKYLTQQIIIAIVQQIVIQVVVEHLADLFAHQVKKLVTQGVVAAILLFTVQYIPVMREIVLVDQLAITLQQLQSVTLVVTHHLVFVGLEVIL